MKKPPALIPEDFDEADVLDIKPPLEPGDPNDNIWYDDFSDVDPNDVVNCKAYSNCCDGSDNNEIIDIEKMQRIKTNDGGLLSPSNEGDDSSGDKMDKLDLLRQKLQSEDNNVSTSSSNDSIILNMQDKEFALIVKGYLILKSKDIQKIKGAITKLITQDKNLKYNNIKIIYNPSLDEIFE